MNAAKTFALTICLVAGALCSTGCDSRPVPSPATGSVTVGGQPSDNALVRLWPVVVDPDPDKVVRPMGYSEADGTFKLTTYEAGDGAPPGKYKVTVEVRPRKKTSMEEDGPDSLEGRYSDAEKSTIEVTINPGPNQIPPIALE